MNRPTYIFIFAILLLAGFGCAEATDTDIQSTSTVQAVIKAPSSVLSLQRKSPNDTPQRKACESRNFSVITRFDTETDSSVEYCQFDDGTECPLASFASGTCGPGDGAAKLTNPDLIVDPITSLTCTDADLPVCGINAHTYANRCIAVQTGIDLAHDGPCTAEDIAAQQAKKTESSNSRSSVVSRAQTFVDDTITNVDSGDRDVPPPATNDPQSGLAPGGTPNWLVAVIALIESSEAPEVPPVYIEACRLNGNVVYIEENDTDKYTSTLYNQKGEIICHPNKDYAGRCPSGAVTGCNQIYLDDR